MRSEVLNLIALGQIPSSKSQISAIEAWQNAVQQVSFPITDEEAHALIKLFSSTEDECYGLAWNLVHLVESAPQWPLKSCLQDTSNPWIIRLRIAAGLSENIYI